MAAATKIDWSKPVLRKQSANCEEPEAIRNATQDEIEESRAAGFEGYIEVEGEGVCFVEE
jgi:hypothetical protein